MSTANALAEALTTFVVWCREHIRGDEKGEAQLFLDHLFRAFGFSAKGDLLQQLLDLNRAVAAKVPEGTQRAGAGDTVIGPGLPALYPDPARLVTPDCLGTDH